MDSDYAIEFQDVSKLYSGDPILERLDLRVRYGETKVVLGGSGSGKSTLLKLVLGLIKPDSGRILVGGQDITQFSEDELMPVRRKIGMVFQEGALFDSLTVGENVAYPLWEQGRHSESEIQKLVERMLGFVGLQQAIQKIPSELSGGMRRRVAIARAMVGSPSILLYDEPTAGLDPITSRTICELIMKLRDIQGVSSILVTHDLTSADILAGELVELRENGEVRFRPEADEFCLINTRFVILQRGRVVFEGTDEEMRRSDNEYIQELLA